MAMRLKVWLYLGKRLRNMVATIPQHTYTRVITHKVIPVGIRKFFREEKYWIPNNTKFNKMAKGGIIITAIAASFLEYDNGFTSSAYPSIPISLGLNYYCFVPGL